MPLIHPIIDECLIESARSTQHLLLRSRSAQEPSTGIDTVGEIQGKRAQPQGHQTSRRSERRLIRDLDPRFRKGAAIGSSVPCAHQSELTSDTTASFLYGKPILRVASRR